MDMTKQEERNFSKFIKENPRLADALVNIRIELEQTKSDLDSLKQCFFALERAVRNDNICSVCAKDDVCDDECYCYIDFEFNEARFTNGGGASEKS